MSKKQKIIFLTVLVVILGGVSLGYYLWQKKRQPEIEEVVLTAEERKQLTLSEEEKKKGLTLEEKEKQIAEQKRSDVLRKLLGKEEKKPEIKVVAINKIIDKKIKFPVLSSDQKKILYFDPEEREFYQTELDGRVLVAMTRGNFANLENVSWSGDRSKAVLSILAEDKKTLEYFYFDFAAQSSQKIDSKFKNVVLSSDGKKIGYIYSEEGKNIFNLSIADPDGKNWRKIAFLSGNEGRLLWLGSEKVIFYHSPQASRQGSLYIYDVLEGKDSFVFTSSKYGFSAKFSQDGRMILWQEGEKDARRLSLYTSELAKGKTATKIPLTGMAEKCAWLSDNTNFICGIPENFSNFYRQPDNWYSSKFISKDSFYKINAKTNEVTRIAEAKQFDKDYDVDSSFMSPGGKTMYFIRKHDGKLYALVMP